MWGIDILGPFPTTKGHVKFLLIAVDFLTKWIKAKPIQRSQLRRFKSSLGRTSFVGMAYLKPS